MMCVFQFLAFLWLGSLIGGIKPTYGSALPVSVWILDILLILFIFCAIFVVMMGYLSKIIVGITTIVICYSYIMFVSTYTPSKPQKDLLSTNISTKYKNKEMLKSLPEIESITCRSGKAFKTEVYSDNSRNETLMKNSNGIEIKCSF